MFTGGLNVYSYIINALGVLLAIQFTGCTSLDSSSKALKMFEQYFVEVSNHSELRWGFTSDTVKLWFDAKEGDPILQFKGKKEAGKWSEWDKAMNAKSYYDSIWYDKNEHAVKGYFFEENDFYKLIGKKPTKTLRTYWINNKSMINEILIYWIPEENTTTAEHLKPIVQWALKYDSIEIQQLYPNGKLIPSKENAIRWKKLLERYQVSLK